MHSAYRVGELIVHAAQMREMDDHTERNDIVGGDDESRFLQPNKIDTLDISFFLSNLSFISDC